MAIEHGTTNHDGKSLQHIGHINLDRKQAGKPSARNGHARFDVAGAENQLTIRLMRHSQRKRGATDRSNLRSLASVLDPTFREGNGNVSIMRSPLRAIAPPDQSYREIRGGSLNFDSLADLSKACEAEK